MEIMKELSRARDATGDIAGRHLGMDNSAVIMARSGARGSMLNLTQMAACVGQQAVRGERIQRGYAGRTLSHFEKGDLGAHAHGFVKASYKGGLSRRNISSTPSVDGKVLWILPSGHPSQDTCRGDL